MLGKELSHPFCLKNKTDQVVSISGIRVSCGRCGYASLAKWQLKPGEETTLVGKMYTSNFVGPKTIWLYVQFSQPQVEEVRLSLQKRKRGQRTFWVRYLKNVRWLLPFLSYLRRGATRCCTILNRLRSYPLRPGWTRRFDLNRGPNRLGQAVQDVRAQGARAFQKVAQHKNIETRRRRNFLL